VGVLLVAWVLFGWVMLLPDNPGTRGFIMLWMYWLATGMYFVAAPVCIAEPVGVGAALSCCRFLTKGRRWQIFVAILVVGILDFAIGITLSASALPEGQGLGATIVSYIVMSASGSCSAPSTRLWPLSSLGQGRRASFQNLRLSGGRTVSTCGADGKR
jgi:hypothetical protein